MGKKTLREILKQMGAEKENIKDWMEQLELTTSGENTPVAYPHDIDCCVNGKKDVIKKTTQKNKKKTEEPHEDKTQEKVKTTEKKTKMTNKLKQEKIPRTRKLTEKTTIKNEDQDKEKKKRE